MFDIGEMFDIGICKPQIHFGWSPRAKAMVNIDRIICGTRPTYLSIIYAHKQTLGRRRLVIGCRPLSRVRLWARLDVRARLFPEFCLQKNK